MGRDSNGNYSLPPGNPVVSGTVIEATWANTTMNDLATEMTDSLSRQGKGGMTANLPIRDAEGSLPGLNFQNEPTSGLLRSGTGDVRMRVLGLDRMRWLQGSTAIPQILNGANWENIATIPLGSALMIGQSGVTAIYLYNATPPPGWAQISLDGNVRNLVVGTAYGLHGSDNPTDWTANVNSSVTVNLPASTGNHTLTFAQMPSHTHFESCRADVGDGATHIACASTTSSTNILTTTETGSAGSNEPHNHSIGGTATGTGNGSDRFRPRYAAGIMVVLD